MSEIIGITEVSRRLGMSDEGVRKLVRTGHLATVEEDPHLAFQPEAIESYLEESWGTVSGIPVAQAAALLGVDIFRIHYLIRIGFLQVSGKARATRRRGRPTLCITPESLARYHRFQEEGVLVLEDEPLPIGSELSLREAARYSGLSTAAIRKGISEERIQVTREKPLRIEKESLFSYSRERTEAKTPAEERMLPAEMSLREAEDTFSVSRYYIQQGITDGKVKVIHRGPTRIDTESLLTYLKELRKERQERILEPHGKVEPPLSLDPHHLLVSFTLHHTGSLTKSSLEAHLANAFESGVEVELIAVGTETDARRHLRATALIRSVEPILPRTVLRKLKYRAGKWVSDPKIEWAPEKKEKG